MYIYAGIDEAGYGPLFGPLVVGMTAFAIPRLGPDAPPPYLWQRLAKAVCRDLKHARGRIAVNDSKKLKSAAHGIRHLELGCLAFASLRHADPHHPLDRADRWLDALGESCHHQLDHLPWYRADDHRPWDALPAACDPGQLAIARSMLTRTASRIGVELADLAAAVVLEDRFNHMVAQTRSKAAASFTFVTAHLQRLWDRFGEHQPFVSVDRQGGRSLYRELLALTFPDAAIAVHAESPEASEYRLTAPAGQAAPARAMTVRFEVEAEAAHMPTALASMVSKYTRELLMARFNAFFAHHAPDVRPTAGYATDAARFRDDIAPHLPRIGITAQDLCRIA